MSAKPTPPRAPPIATKLEVAREVLRDLERDVGQFVLDATEGVPGAAKRLADLRTTISAAQRDVGELEQAHALAMKLDRQADAALAGAMRTEQFAIMKRHADARLKAVATIMEAIGTAAAAYGEYVRSTNDMAVALPTGTRMGFVALGRNGYGGPWAGDLKALIAAEAWRLMPTLPGGEKCLPFAKAPDLANDDHTKLQAGLDVMIEAQTSVLRDIEIQMDRLNAESAALAKGEAA
ncbi:hypothetical protein [Tardiphaga sp.]|uniref:hypothetical protein n=1 Tax=Tardiphaga sp. TaxID=1926292 RepID=UPI00262F71D3|nr:hypothetical protein [Tardiphaga sp.]MDB5616596.1 hypothetical protein [Tardiphaga sp.]